MSALVGSMDVGTNTVRLLLAEVDGGRIVRNLLDMRANTRLGEGLRASGMISETAAARTLAAIEEFAAAMRPHKPDVAGIVGTEAIRRASNPDGFTAEVKRRTGMDMEIISGREEANRMLMGVRAGLGDMAGEGPKLVVDIGGGSTELVATEDFESHEAVSVPVGAVTLYEDCVKADPPTDGELESARRRAEDALEPHKGCLRPGGRLIGTAGTITTLAAVDLRMYEYDPARVTGHDITREALTGMIRRFAGMDAASRSTLPGLEKGREDIIITGAVLLGVIMDIPGYGHITVSDYGLREGNLLYLFNKI